MKATLKQLAAHCTATLGLALLAAALPAAAQDEINCAKMPATCEASIGLVQAQERFRIAYLTEKGACGRVGACSIGVRPNSIGGSAGMLSFNLKNMLPSCEVACDEQYKDDEKKRLECRAACSGATLLKR